MLAKITKINRFLLELKIIYNFGENRRIVRTEQSYSCCFQIHILCHVLEVKIDYCPIN